MSRSNTIDCRTCQVGISGANHFGTASMAHFRANPVTTRSVTNPPSEAAARTRGSRAAAASPTQAPRLTP